jgi:hypothetical protein
VGVSNEIGFTGRRDRHNLEEFGFGLGLLGLASLERAGKRTNQILANEPALLSSLVDGTRWQLHTVGFVLPHGSKQDHFQAPGIVTPPSISHQLYTFESPPLVTLAPLCDM